MVQYEVSIKWMILFENKFHNPMIIISENEKCTSLIIMTEMIVNDSSSIFRNMLHNTLSDCSLFFTCKF